MAAPRVRRGQEARPAHSASRPVLEVRGLCKSVGAARARQPLLRDLELELERGEMVAVLGRSGSGKSTLLHLLGGLDTPDAGRIELEGASLTDASERALSRIRLTRLGFIFQSFELIEELSGEENVMLAAALPGAPRRGRARARALIERLGVGDVAHRAPHELSGGERQRIAIARALVNDPVLLLADEPTGSLDESSGATVLELLNELAGEGRAVIMVTHETRAAAAADRVLHLLDGRLHAAGPGRPAGALTRKRPAL